MAPLLLHSQEVNSMNEYKGVMVYCEVKEKKLQIITSELLGCGKKLSAALGEELIAILLCSELNDLAQEAISLGADKAYVVCDPLLENYLTEPHVLAMEKVVEQVKPKIIIMGQTSVGRDLAPRLAFKMGTAASMDCVELTIDSKSKQVLYTRPVYGGKALATLTYECYPQIATIRARSILPLERDTSRRGEIVYINVDVDSSAIKSRIINKVPKETEGMKLEDAEIIVSGGRGIGSAEGFKQLAELAEVLKGALGASRPPCDNGWAPLGIQIGLTANVVAPDLYIAVALSGASQHMAGCSRSKKIVAINKDAEAPIFKVADFGIVADWKSVVPVLTNKIR